MRVGTQGATGATTWAKVGLDDAAAKSAAVNAVVENSPAQGASRTRKQSSNPPTAGSPGAPATCPVRTMISVAEAV